MPDADLIAIRMRLTGGKQVAAEAKAANAAIAETGTASKKAAAQSATASRNLAKTASTLRSTGRGLTTYVTAPVIAAGAAAGYMALDFDRAMRNVNSIAQLPQRRFEQLKQGVLDLAGPTAQAPKTLAEGLYDLVSSGFDAKESMHILEKAAYAATAGLTTTEVSTAAIAAALNAYHLPASKAGEVSDTLFETVNRGVINFNELGSQLGYIVSSAASAGISLQELGAAISTNTLAGQVNGQAITNLNQTITAFAKPSEAMTTAVKELGYENAESLLKTRGLIGAVQDLGKTAGGSQEKLAGYFGNVRANRGALPLIGEGAKVANENLAAFNNVAGSTNRVLKEQEKSFGLQLQRGWAELSTILIEIGQEILPVVVPFLMDLAEGVKAAVTWFADLPSPVQKTALALGGIIALTGPMLLFASAVLRAATSLGVLKATEAGGIGLGGGGKLLGRLGIAGLGVGAAQLGGGAIGGDLGSWVKGAGTGAAIGFGIGGPLGAAAGGAIGGMAAAVQKLTASEERLSVVDQKLARNRKVIAQGLRDQEAAGASLRSATGRMVVAQDREKAATRRAERARRALVEINRQYGAGSRPAIRAEMRLAEVTNAHREAVRRLRNAERKRGVELQAYKQIARTNVLNQRNEVNNLTRKRNALEREFVAAKKSGANNARLNDLATRYTRVSQRAEGAQKKLNQTLEDAAQKAGPKYAEWLRRADRESLQFGSTMKALESKANNLANALERIATTPAMPNLPGTPRLRAGKNAAGTEWWRGGLSLVGERGPELVDIPRGSRVLSAPRTREALGALPRRGSAAQGGGGDRVMVPVVLKVGRKILAEVVAETQEDAEARL